MRVKVIPGDFVVEEQAELGLVSAGPWAVYRVRKVGLDTLTVQTELAAALQLRREQVIFPGLKDKEAVAFQFATLPTGQPETLEGPRWAAHRVGWRDKPLAPANLRGNAFTLILRDLDAEEAAHLTQRLQEIRQYGLPNYFDEQRFGSYAPAWGLIGKAILARDAEEALRAYLTRPFLGDLRPVRAFKRTAAPLWPNWRAMMAVAPKPSNYRSVLTYLIDHPDSFRKALNLIPQRLLALYLAAYQSDLWNRIAAAFLARVYAQAGLAPLAVTIIERALPIHRVLGGPLAAQLAGMQLALPQHRATFRSPEIAALARQVLAEEGLTMEDLKARILQKAYLSKGERALLVLPEGVEVGRPKPDEHFPGRLALRVRFTLPPGSYATLVLKAAQAGR